MTLFEKITPLKLNVTQPLPAQPKVMRRDFIASVLLGSLLISTTSLDYIWYGPAPAWLILLVIGILMSIILPSHRLAFIQFLRRTWLPIILPWLIFVLAVATIDTFKGLIDETFSKRVNLNLATLVLMVMIGTWSARVRPAIVINVLAFIACIQGIICIAQYSNNALAWNLPELIVKYSGARFDKELFMQGQFDLIGRVRGTNPLVHKFNSMQGAVGIFLMAILVLNYQAKNILHLRQLMLLTATIFGGIGMILTFSRSTILGGLLAILVILINVRKFAAVAILVVVGILGYYASQELGIQKAEQFGRITDFSTNRVTNVSRIQQYAYALRVFADNPFIGQSEGEKNQRVLVHSVVLRLLTDYGIAGAIPYLAVLLGIAWVLLRYRSFDRNYAKVITLAAFCSIGVVIIDSWTHSSGLLVRDVAQPALVGAYFGTLLGQTPKTGDRLRNQIACS